MDARGVKSVPKASKVKSVRGFEVIGAGLLSQEMIEEREASPDPLHRIVGRSRSVHVKRKEQDDDSAIGVCTCLGTIP